MTTRPSETGKPSKLRADAKSLVRRLVRRTGYDLVHLATGLPNFQARLLSQCSQVLDVGANVGQFAERVRDLGFQGRITSFEPEPSAFELLADRAAQSDQWAVRKIALGETRGTAQLHVSSNSVSSSLLPIRQEHVDADHRSRQVADVSVEISTLDEEVSLGDSDLLYLKLDVQGFELPVLRGGNLALSRTLAVQTEVSFERLYDGQTNWLDLTSWLQEQGFKVNYVEPGFENPSTGQMLQADFIFMRDQRLGQ